MIIRNKKKEKEQSLESPSSDDYFKKLLYFEELIEMDPNNYDVYRLIGDIYAYNLPDDRKAIYYYEKYAELYPKNALVYNMLGHLYSKLGRYQNIDKQIEYFEKAIEIMPDLKETYRNLMVVYPRVGREKDAIKCFYRLLKLGASMDDHFNYACLNIKLKNFKEGWQHYEYRFLKETGPTPYPEFNKPKWKGQKILDKTLLVQYEQGYGDSIQFFRYLPQLKPLVGKIIFRTHNELADLFSINTNDAEIVKASVPLEELSFDYHVPIMSLMHFLGATVDNIPFAEGSIKADEAKIKDYKEQHFDNDCFKIGISWHGAEHGNNLRNVPLEHFYPLTKLKNVKVYSFQKGVGSEELEKLPSGVEIVDLGKTFNDFSDTAAAIANMDLFITSDNAVFNLAASMGKKTFLLLGKDAEWRWFLDEDTNPWYDSVKVFRKQDENDSWAWSIERVIGEISEIQHI